LATIDDLKRNVIEADVINKFLFRRSARMKSLESKLEYFSYENMTQDDIDAWYTWDRAWIENESVREMYAGLIALESL